MPADYYVALKDASGARVALFDKFFRLQYHKQRNEPGWIKLDLYLPDPDDREALFVLDGQVEIWRRGDWSGASWYVDFEGLHRRPEYYMLEEGDERFQSWSVGYLDLLIRRIGLYWLYNRDAYTRDGYLVIDSTPPEIIEEFVNREAGPGAIYAGVDRRTTGLTLAAIAPAGAAVEETLRNENLLLRCQQIAQAYGLDIQIVGTGAATFEFRCAPYLGTDRRITAADPTIFAPRYGNMRRPRYIVDRLTENTHAFVGGEGTGLDRTIYHGQDAGRSAESPWNRREVFVDARELNTEAKLATRSTGALEEGSPIRDLDFEVIETDACMYGRDYDLHDLVTGIYRAQLNYRVEAVTVTVDRTGREMIRLDLVEYP